MRRGRMGQAPGSARGESRALKPAR